MEETTDWQEAISSLGHQLARLSGPGRWAVDHVLGNYAESDDGRLIYVEVGMADLLFLVSALEGVNTGFTLRRTELRGHECLGIYKGGNLLWVPEDPESPCPHEMASVLRVLSRSMGPHTRD